ncbi:MAG: S-adenosylmethionine:tRNA ribosyltransferase-isomerase, partial [Eubacterium sp.]|nr:S-adenosylmethionine:tRNA ribosyltransferase-isomerase [Eubacterium sp.]
MKTSDFYYELPKELIAQDPIRDRSASRLLVLNKKTGGITHTVFREILTCLRQGDCLVLNDTRVLPARLYGTKAGTGARIEILLLKRESENEWETLVRPGKKCRPGTEILFCENGREDPLLRGTITDVLDDGNRRIRFSYDGIFEEILDRLGEMPLPPYITHKLEDKERYQTVYAEHNGSAAAPTAGLHFTPELLKEIEEKGVQIARVTLHVGLGTFR